MKKINLLAAVALSVGLASCSIDNTENYKELSTSKFPALSEDAEAVLAGAYFNLNKMAESPQTSFLYYACLASDDQLGGGGPNDKLMQAEDLMLNYGSDMTNFFYEQRYSGINRANLCLAAVPNLPLSDEEKAQMAGEAKFLRAFYYYELASMYGNVPVRVTPTTEPIELGTPAEVWGQILQDLYEASTEMPKVRKNDGHIDRFTAQAMLGRAWLFYTGMYCNGEDITALTSTTYKPLESVALPNGETLTKAQVVACIDECVNESEYDLVPDFRNQWAYTNRCTKNDYKYTAEAKDKDGNELKWVEDDMANKGSENPESMFAIKFNKLASWSTTIGYSNGYALHFGMRGDARFPFGSGWGAGIVATNLYQDWSQASGVNEDKSFKDVRLAATIVDCNSELDGFSYGGGSDWMQETGFYNKKWSPIMAKDGSTTYNCFENVMYGKDGGLSGGYGNNMQLDNIHDLVLIRFADVLLMQSELKEEVSGINKVRARAGLEPIGAYSLKALQDERRWELACEGIRWNDIRRWHIAAAALAKQQDVKVWTGGQADTNKAHNGGYAARYNATAGFNKIPESQVSFGIPQNAGYTDASGEYAGW